MLRRFFRRLNNKKVKVFTLFLVVSLLAWSVSKLSETQNAWMQTTMSPVNLPDSLLMKSNATPSINLRLQATGFRLLWLLLGKKEIDIDLAQIDKSQYRYYLTKNKLRPQIQQKLSSAVELMDIEQDTLFFDLYQVRSKRVPVEPNINLQMAANHILKGAISIEPDSITIKGPAREIDTITSLKTALLERNAVDSDFMWETELQIPDGLVDSEYSATKVSLRGEVVRFSEKIFEIPISVENITEGFGVRTFPSEVRLLCKAAESDLLDITKDDFQVKARYNPSFTNSDKLSLQLGKKPEKAISVKLMQNEVEFLLEKK